MSMIVIVIIIVVVAIMAGKLANKTVMNAVRIASLIIGIFTLVRNWDSTSLVLDKIIFKALPDLFDKACEIVDRVVNFAIHNSDKTNFKQLK